jgi:tetratricopeptide (TPR) repeat protein
MNANELFQEAQHLLLEGRDKESIEFFTKAADAGYETYTVMLSRGVAYLKVKDADKAVSDFNAAIAANGKSARAYYYRGNANLLKEQYEVAEKDFTKAMELKSGYAQALFARASAYAGHGKYEEAAQDLRKVLPEMSASVQSFVDTFGIVRTQMWKVMSQLSGEGRTPMVDLTEEEIKVLKEWLG